jgi:hypothetical protein
MKAPVYVDIDPRTLHLPWSRRDGADPAKLARQISLYGASTQGMPPPFVYRGTDGGFVINDGVTRATMMNPVRQDLLNTLAELSATMPDVRFGQLIANLSTLARGLSAEGLWDAEDEQLLAAAREQLAYFAEHAAKSE